MILEKKKIYVYIPQCNVTPNCNGVIYGSCLFQGILKSDRLDLENELAKSQ